MLWWLLACWGSLGYCRLWYNWLSIFAEKLQQSTSFISRVHIILAFVICFLYYLLTSSVVTDAVLEFVTVWLIHFLCVCVLSRLSIIRAFVIGFMMTFFEVFDVPVFWPILLFYWVMLFILTMRKQIQHMIKYRYVPFSFGKQVCVFFCCTLQNVAYLTIVL